jgi:hypothetical protein
MLADVPAPKRGEIVRQVREALFTKVSVFRGRAQSVFPNFLIPSVTTLGH